MKKTKRNIIDNLLKENEKDNSGSYSIIYIAFKAKCTVKQAIKYLNSIGYLVGEQIKN